MFSKDYPNIEWWIENQGWIELGEDLYSTSWVRILDIGGMYWQDETAASLDDALRNADRWLSQEIQDRMGLTSNSPFDVMNVFNRKVRKVFTQRTLSFYANICILCC